MGNMNKITKTPLFFRDKPLFGLDIGPASLKVMQVDQPAVKVNGKISRLPQVIGYGFTTFDRSATEDGVILNHEIIAKAARELFDQHLIGNVTTRRVALAIPAYRTFTRSLELPLLQDNELMNAVELEAEQYVSVPLDQLYLDYEVTKRTQENMELFAVAVPKTIVDSYMELAELLGLEVVLIEPTLSSSGRLFAVDDQSDVPTVIIDFGSKSADISIYDEHILVTGTVQAGGETFTQIIKEKLNVTVAEAGLIKTRYGLGVSRRQAEITKALEPVLGDLVKEIRRMMRYHEERYGADRPIQQIITLGGGANMPGLSDYLTNVLRLAVRHTNPWHYLTYKGLQPPSEADKPMYATVAGLCLADSKQVIHR